MSPVVSGSTCSFALSDLAVPQKCGGVSRSVVVAGRPECPVGMCCCLVVLGKPQPQWSCTGAGCSGDPAGGGGCSGVVQAYFCLQPLPQPL